MAGILTTRLVGLSLGLALFASGCDEVRERTFEVTTKGGQFSAGAVTLTVPPGAVTDPFDLTIARYVGDAGAVLTGTAHTLRPTETVFTRPVVLTIWLDGSAVPAGTAATDLSLVERLGTAWFASSGDAYAVDPARWVSASIARLGIYAVRGPAAVVPDGGADLGSRDAGLDVALEAGAGDLGPADAGPGQDAWAGPDLGGGTDAQAGAADGPAADLPTKDGP